MFKIKETGFIFTYKVLFPAVVKAFEKKPQGDARFPPKQTRFQTFLSVEILAASAREERLGRKAHQTSLGKTLFPQLTEEAVLKTEVKTVPTAPTHNLHCERFWCPYITIYLLAKRGAKGLKLN